MSSQIESLTTLLIGVRDIEDEERNDDASLNEQKRKILPKFINTLLRLQRIFIDILECPMGRLMDCLLALSTQTYKIFEVTLTEEENITDFIKLAENELALMED